MPWAKLDDRLHTNRKVMKTSNDAFAVWICSITYCAEQTTDGILNPREAIRVAGLRGAGQSAIDELTAAGLWDCIPGGSYLVHDYLQYNPTKEQVIAEKEATRKRQDAFRSKREEPPNDDTVKEEHQPESVSNAVTDAVTNAVVNGVSNAMRNACSRIPVPGTPDPNPTKEEPVSAETGAPEVAPSLAVACRQLLEECAKATKKGAIVGKAYLIVFGAETSPNYGRLSALAKDTGGPLDLIRLMFRVASTYDGWGDPHDYLTKAVYSSKGNARVNGRSPPVSPYMTDAELAEKTRLDREQLDAIVLQDRKRWQH